MRKTFTLLVEFRGDMRGHEKRKVAETLQMFAEQQDIQTFGYEDANLGQYALMAHPEYIDKRKDDYELRTFRATLEPLLSRHKDIDSFTLQPVTGLSELFPKTGASPPQPVSRNITNRDKRD